MKHAELCPFATRFRGRPAFATAVFAADFDPEGVKFDSPGCSAAEPWVRVAPRTVSPNGATFLPRRPRPLDWQRLGLGAVGITPFQGYDVLSLSETQGCTLGYRMTHLRCCGAGRRGLE